LFFESVKEIRDLDKQKDKLELDTKETINELDDYINDYNRNTGIDS
jgi:uncharacterized protein (UPF0305 family)